MEYLSVIQGDALDVVVTIDNPYELSISKVQFVCQSLELEVELDPANIENTFMLYVAPEKTQSLWIGNWNFDIEVFLDSGERYTVIHDGRFEVIKKKEF